MTRIIDSRASGKTSGLMLLAKDANGVIVCGNPYAMITKAHAYGIIGGIDFVSYKDYLDGNYDHEKKVFIDELECFVKSIGNNLSGYTLSNED